ncbi:MAG TPA: cytochrome c3 family protein, partial [Gemmatimonadales bacterium]
MSAPQIPTTRQRVRRWLRTLVPIAILGVILLVLGTVGFVEYSAQPGFCKGCHNMVPYYDSWATSSHNDVPCIKCHYAPGIKAEAMGKLQAANQVVKYVTGSFGTRPWAEIDDAACLRSGCHSERRVEGALDYNGVSFDHAKHLGELRRGKQLRCTSCHSQIVQGDHLTVTPETCVLCHFKDRPVGEPVGGCIGCHPSPPKVESASGYVVEHARYVADRISCVSCHQEVTTGDGAADRARCYICHNEPERIAVFDNPTRVHQIHITEHKVECSQCHSEIQHKLVKEAVAVELDCKSCHSKAHDAQLQLYAGTGGHQTGTTPSKMFQARVSCLGCHEESAKIRGHEKVQVAGEASCLSCHGVRYNNILPSWQKEMDLRVSRVAPVVARARAVLNAAGPGRRGAADSLLRLAEENLDLVRIGKPAHNVAFADELLRASLDLVRAAVKAGRLPYAVPALDLGPRVEETTCSACHLGVERATVSFRGGGTFPHEPHVLRGGLTCAQCHTPFDQHGGTRISTTASCQDCHHSQAKPTDCAACHRGAGSPGGGVMKVGGAAFPHGAHQRALPTCAPCHAAPSMTIAAFSCTDCH